MYPWLSLMANPKAEILILNEVYIFNLIEFVKCYTNI